MTDDQHDQLPLAASPASPQVDGLAALPAGGVSPDDTHPIGEPTVRTSPRRRRGSRGGRNRRKPAGAGGVAVDGDNEDRLDEDEGDDAFESDGDLGATSGAAADEAEPELPKRMSEGRP